jgi:DNA mismatch repair protein MutL
MAKILQLDPHVADLIAAGEVVERPASVVKELMENSIDAGSTLITVEIKSGGMTFLRVTDNGGGIAAEDAETAFLRHATSKLRNAEGLEAIATLGFRGEALAAIAAVSRIELLTRETGASEGTSLSVEGGVVTSRTAAGCPEGTTMIVRDLFFNTPARLKFMKTDRAEGAGVSTAVLSCALSHPEVSVRYIKDGKEEFHTPGDGRLNSCIYSLLGREFSQGLLEAKTNDGEVMVNGYVSTPVSARGNRSYQYFFVNGRHIKSKTLQAALEQAYKNSLFTGRFPACVLYLTLRLSTVDVNVHPTKTEVKFLNERQVFDGVYYATLAALNGEAESAEVKLTDSTRNTITVSDAPADGPNENRPMTVRPYPDNIAAVRPAVPLSADKEPAEKPKFGGSGFYQSISADKFRSTYGGGGFISRTPSMPEQTAYESVHDDTRVVYETQKPEPVYEPQEIEGMPEKTPHRIIGEALGTYILAEREGSLWLIDKHAAHERIHFDRLKSGKQVTMSQTLMSPVICELGRDDMALLTENAALIEQFGFEIESFGETSAAVRRIPSDIDIDEIEATLGEFCEVLRRGGRADPDARLDEILHTIACKAAIKAGRRSEPSELESLVTRVLSGEIRYCPHGRPVAMELTKMSLDRSFKRT